MKIYFVKYDFFFHAYSMFLHIVQLETLKAVRKFATLFNILNKLNNKHDHNKHFV